MSGTGRVDDLHALLDRSRQSLKQLDERIAELEDAESAIANQPQAKSVAKVNRAMIKVCETQMVALEGVLDLTAEEKNVMGKLNDLINMGDHNIHKINSLFEKFGIQEDREKDLETSEEVKPSNTNVRLATSEARRTKTSPKAQTEETHIQSAASMMPSTSRSPSSLKFASTIGKEPKPHTPQPWSRSTFQKTPAAKPKPYVPGSDPFGLYAVMNLDPLGKYEASSIKKSYHRRLVVLHPDKGANRDDVDANERFLFFQEASKILMNEKQRQNYDERGEVPPGFGYGRNVDEGQGLSSYRSI